MKPPFSEMCCATAPLVLEFDQQGNLLRRWSPGPNDPWMDQEHGIHIDHRNNVWLGGGGGGDDALPRGHVRQRQRRPRGRPGGHPDDGTEHQQRQHRNPEQLPEPLPRVLGVGQPGLAEDLVISAEEHGELDGDEGGEQGIEYEEWKSPLRASARAPRRHLDPVPAQRCGGGTG